MRAATLRISLAAIKLHCRTRTSVYKTSVKQTAYVFYNKAASQIGLAYSTPDLWLEVSLHPEGPATGQLDQGFPWFSLVPERMLSRYPNSSLHCMLLTQPSKYELFKNFRHNIALPKSDYISPHYSRSNIFKNSKLKKSPIQASPLPEGLAGTAWEPSKLPNYVPITPPSKTVASLTTSRQISSSLLS
jgi:hypothetical protein